ncbi:MAG: MmgE/PrpD family protein [Rhodoferax sp.]
MPVTELLAAHIATSQTRALPAAVMDKAAVHVLDTVAAMVSGTRLPAGERALAWIRLNAGRGDAVVVGCRDRAPVAMAALANGVMAHADETDDSHAASLTHPGCAVVPAALAVADWVDASGADFLRAVTVGYDVGPRVARALGGERFFDQHHSSHSVGGLFGAIAAAASLLRFDAAQCAAMLAYGVQQASGNACWRRDPDHIEKAFDFGGMPAHHAVLAATLVQAGFTGSGQPLEGVPGLFAAHPATADAALAVEGLGERHEILGTAIKKWCVGSPIQSALDATLHLMTQAGLQAGDVERILVSLPRQSAPVVDRRAMPAVNLQFQLALLLTDRRLTFESGHDAARMRDPAVHALSERIQLDPRPEQAFIDNSRQAIVQAFLRDGRVLRHHTLHVRGTPADPMTLQEVQEKALDLMQPVLGPARAQPLIRQLGSLPQTASVRSLHPLLHPDD